MTSKPNTTQAITLQRNLAGGHSKFGHTDWMGTHVSIPFQFPAMAINGAAKSYADGGWISSTVVYTLPALGNGMTTDLCMGWTFG